jgi:hypothetical protein
VATYNLKLSGRRVGVVEVLCIDRVAEHHQSLQHAQLKALHYLQPLAICAKKGEGLAAGQGVSVN